MTKSIIFKKDGSTLGRYLECLLSKLGCTQVKITAVPDCQIFCGFQSEDSKILDYIAKIFPIVHGYQEARNYILVLSREGVDKKLDEYFRDIFHKVIDIWNTKGIGYHILSSCTYPTSRRTRLSDAGQAYLKGHGQCLNDLAKYGLGLKHEQEHIEVSFYFNMGRPRYIPPHQITPCYDYIGVDDWEEFAELTIVQSGVRDAIFKAQKTAFLMAQHKSAGAESKALNFSDAVWFEKHLLEAVIAWIAPESHVKKTSVVFFKPVIIGNNAEAKSEEKQIDGINKLKNDLQAEIDSVVPYPNKERKQTKTDFLSWILLFKEINPGFSIKICFECAKHILGDLNYQEVLLGNRSDRTHSLLMTINH